MPALARTRASRARFEAANGLLTSAPPHARHASHLLLLHRASCHAAPRADSAHFDGGQTPEATKLTAVLYCNEQWSAADGGKLKLLDERGGCWRSVTPAPGRLILFLVKDCLHKVEPCYA